MPNCECNAKKHAASRIAARGRKWLWVMWVMCACVWSVRAQYRFDHWTADNGLPQNSVRDIVQTRDGYLWFTTFDGLVRFDGVRFTVFNKSNTPGIPSNRFYAILEDRQGDLWATLETGEVVRRHQGRFTSFNRAHGLSGEINPSLVEDEQGNLLITYYGLNFDEQGNSVMDIKRVYRWAAGRFEPAAELRYDFAALPIPAAEAITTTWGKIIGGDYWIVTRQRFIRYRKGGGVQTYHERNGLPGKPLVLLGGASSATQVFTRDAAGRLWLTDLQSWQSQLLSSQIPAGFDLWMGYADVEGNYWFSSNNNGLFRARRQTIATPAKLLEQHIQEVYSLLESHDGALWIGTAGSALQAVFRFKDGTLTQYPPAEIKDAQSFGGAVSSLFEDRAGQIWVNGFWRLVEGRYLSAPWAEALEFQNKTFNWTMCEDRAGAYWFGSTNGVVRVQNGAVTQFTTKDGLAGNDTKVIIEDGQGGLWLGSYGGLTHYRDGKFTAWTEKDGLPGATVRALKLDSDGTLWIGTYDSGLARFKGGRFTSYTTKDGLFDNGVFQILEDDFGWFWMSCNRGIYRVRKQELLDFADGKTKTLTCLAYNQSDGMPSSECNGGRWPAGVKTRDGKLWFPTMGGVAMIDPTQIKANTQPPPVVLEELRINNQPASLDAWDAAIQNPNFALQIYPGQDNFEIAYTALSFINSENMRFKYKLEGADADWVDAGTRRTAYFSHLAPGSYTFHVIAANADGVWNEKGASVRITVVPPFWRTWWFVALAGVSVAGLIVGAVVYRDQQQKRRLAAQQAAQQAFARQLIESQETERKRIAAELHDSLGQNLLIVKNRAQLGQLAAQQKDPELLEQFEWIVHSASQSLEEVREIAQNLRPYHLDRLGLTKALEVMIEKVAGTTKIRFVTELVPLDDLFSKEDAITLYRVVQESLNNIVKHAQATEARVSVRRTTDSVTLTIHDNGRGFSPLDVAAKPPGFGLHGMAERVRMLGGEWQLDSQEGQGTTVTIHFALPISITRGTK
ncbi:MAG TPA: two-component regulator propeller domain-containing protein [Blastocatellia bacterium]|nr:two-component regulator propeller domain-containing protein [Blastocatellia bacterium]